MPIKNLIVNKKDARSSKDAKQGPEAERLVRPGRNGPHAWVTHVFRGAKRASGDRRLTCYKPGRDNFVAAKGEERISARTRGSEKKNGF